MVCREVLWRWRLAFDHPTFNTRFVRLADRWTYVTEIFQLKAFGNADTLSEFKTKAPGFCGRAYSMVPVKVPIHKVVKIIIGPALRSQTGPVDIFKGDRAHFIFEPADSLQVTLTSTSPNPFTFCFLHSFYRGRGKDTVCHPFWRGTISPHKIVEKFFRKGEGEGQIKIFFWGYRAGVEVRCQAGCGHTACT